MNAYLNDETTTLNDENNVLNSFYYRLYKELFLALEKSYSAGSGSINQSRETYFNKFNYEDTLGKKILNIARLKYGKISVDHMSRNKYPAGNFYKMMVEQSNQLEKWFGINIINVDLTDDYKFSIQKDKLSRLLNFCYKFVDVYAFCTILLQILLKKLEIVNSSPDYILSTPEIDSFNLVLDFILLWQNINNYQDKSGQTEPIDNFYNGYVKLIKKLMQLTPAAD
jgi:hypothetical protein